MRCFLLFRLPRTYIYFVYSLYKAKNNLPYYPLKQSKILTKNMFHYTMSGHIIIYIDGYSKRTFR